MATTKNTDPSNEDVIAAKTATTDAVETDAVTPFFKRTWVKRATIGVLATAAVAGAGIVIARRAA